MNIQTISPHPDTTVELLDAPPPVMRRPLALIDGHAYAATWLYTRTTRSESHDKHGHLVQHDPPLVETGLRLHVVRDDGTLFGPGGDHPLPALGLDVILPEMPPPSRTWSAQGLQAYRTGARPNPLDVLNRVAGVVTRFVDFDRSLADQPTMAELVACFIMTTWLLDAFNVVGYLWPSGERGSGKTVLLHTVAEMASPPAPPRIRGGRGGATSSSPVALSPACATWPSTAPPSPSTTPRTSPTPARPTPTSAPSSSPATAVALPSP